MSKKKGIIIAAVVLALLGGGGYGIKTALSSVQLTNATYTAGRVAVKDLSDYVNVSGSVASSESISVTAAVDQKITQLNVKIGDAVKAGDVLCVFDDTALRESYNRLMQTEEKSQGAEDYQHNLRLRALDDARNERDAAVNKAQETLNDAVAARNSVYDAYNSATAQYEALNSRITDPDHIPEEIAEQLTELAARINQLGEQMRKADEAVSDASYARNEAAKRGDQGVRAAQDALDAEAYAADDGSVESQIKKLSEQLDSCTVKAPADGVVTQLMVSEGSIPMSPSLMEIEDTSSLIIRGKVSEADVLKVSEGMNCEIKTVATGEEIIPGKLTRIERILNSSDPTAAGGYNVEISIDSKESNLLIGMSANVKIILDRADHVLCVPYDAIRGGENDGYFVYVAVPQGDGNSKVEKRVIEKGFEGDYFTEIASGELKEDEIVLSRRNTWATITEGQTISDSLLNVPDDESQDAEA